MKGYSLYTDVVLFFFSFFSKTSARARERRRVSEREARGERNAYFLHPPSLHPYRAPNKNIVQNHLNIALLNLFQY